MMLRCVPLLLHLVAMTCEPAAKKPNLVVVNSREGSSTQVYAAGNAVNGMLVGSLGPSLHDIGKQTGLSAAGLGRVVLINRLSKLSGSLLWTAYARDLQSRKGDERPLLPPHLLLCCSMTISSACALAIAMARSSRSVLYAALALAGCCCASAGLDRSGCSTLPAAMLSTAT